MILIIPQEPPYTKIRIQIPSLNHLNPTKKIKIAYIIIDKKEWCTAYTDITGEFPQKSSWGNQYLFIGYHYDVNCILAEPMRDRTSTSITNAWSKLNDIFAKAGAASCTYVLDKKNYNEFIQDIRQHQTSYLLVPPHTHRRNIAKRAIQTYRNHFKGVISIIDPNFPLSEWDRFI